MTMTIQQPKAFDIVGDPVLFGGFGTGFEAVFSWRVHDGHDERTGSIHAGGGTGEHGQYQVAAAIGPNAFQLDRIFVEVFEESASGSGEELHKVIVPVIFGPRIVPNYVGCITVKAIDAPRFPADYMMPRCSRVLPAPTADHHRSEPDLNGRRS